MSEAAAEPVPGNGEHEQKVTWLELFFDLVVVVAVAQLAARLEEHGTVRGVGVFVVLYGAVWMAWTSFTLYANVSAGAVRQRAFIFAMAGMAVMATAIPDATTDRATVFAASYVIVRVIAQNVFNRTHKAVVAWSAAQVPYGVLPWFVSVFVDSPARFYLWAAGLAIEFTMSVVRSGHPEEVVEGLRKRERDERAKRWARDARRARMGLPVSTPALVERISAATLNIGHLGERLGLFVIIVLGEAVAQLIGAAAHADWSRGREFAAVAGFALLVGLWSLIFRYGFTSVPQFGVATLPPRLALPIHFVTTGAITALAAGLGASTHDASEHLPTTMRWVLCAGTGVYFLVTGIGAVATRAPWHWLLGWALPSVAVPVVVGALGGPLPAWAVAALMTAVVLWQVFYVPLREQWTARVRHR
ncbi:MAG TPA: low temperature requirement protein A [Streptosporangiaceae bacterium]|jgi:low temperature requirement protein LtrA